MSLLLDALKKAESEKKKSSGDSGSPDDALDIDESGTDSPEVDHESLELELELDNTSSDKAPDATFPEVDEDTIVEHMEREVQLDQPDHLPESERPPHDSTEDKTDSTDFDLDESPLHIDTDSTLDEDNTTSTVDPIDSLHTGEDTSSDSNYNTDVNQPPDNPGDAPPDITKRAVNRIESEKALSALINKTNQHQRKENLKRNITVAFLVLLILTGSALYFYIETSTTSQSLYLAQNNQATIDRSSDRINVPTSNQQPEAVEEKASTDQVVKATDQAAIVTTKASLNKSPARQNTSAPTQATVQSKPQSTQTMSIVHSTKPDPINALLQQAYKSFQNGDLQTSESLYNQVLLREANNRDALLGVSAIAMKQQRYEYARHKYQSLLKLNPRDSIAIAGINSIESRLDPQLSESQLKFMLKQQPNDSHLHFALGSLYSKQQRWAEAQSAYFSAWSADSDNADYAFNLAVSLDHMNKQKQALEFYQRSLQLMSTSNANFSAQQASARIATLQPRFQ